MGRDPSELAIAAAAGESGAADELAPLVYAELRDLAGRYLRSDRGRRAQTLQPTALVHEAYLKLVDQESGDARSRTHFFSVAALAMQQILLDHLRAGGRDKRGGGWQRVTLADGVALQDGAELDALGLQEALARLESLDERAAKVVRMRFYAGLTELEIAELLGVSERTVRNDWSMARAWLRVELERADTADPDR